MPIKECKEYKKTDIFCRRNSSTIKCEYYDLQNILNNKIKTGHNSIDKFNLRNELKELELLMSYETPQKQLYYSIHNPNFLKKVSELKQKKEKVIEKGLKIDELEK